MNYEDEPSIEELVRKTRIALEGGNLHPESMAPLIGGREHGELMPVDRSSLRVEIGDSRWRLYALNFGNEIVLVYKHSDLREDELHPAFVAWAGSHLLELVEEED